MTSQRDGKGGECGLEDDIRNDQQQGKNSPRPWEMQQNKTQGRSQGWGAFARSHCRHPSQPSLVCSSSAPEPSKAPTLLFPVCSQHCQESMAEEEQTLPSSLWFTQQGWGLGQLALFMNIRCLSFWDFSPVSDGDTGTAEPGFAAALLLCGRCVCGVLE